MHPMQNNSLASRVVTLVFAVAVFVVSIANAADSPPALLKPIAPVYPPDLFRAGKTGAVAVEFIVDPKGDVIEAHVAKESTKSPWQFQYAAVVAVWQWKFQPGVKEGKPVSVRVVQTLEFNITN